MNSPQIILASDVQPSGPLGNVSAVEQKLSPFETVWGIGAVRKTALILVLAIIWQVYATYLDNPLLFPTLSDTLITLYDRFVDGTLPNRIWTTLQILFMGYFAGTVLAALLTVVAINTQIGTDFLETMTAMFNPLPAISLLPLALIWFGLGASSLVFVLIHSVLWAVALNTHSGFLGVSRTLRMVGANYGLTGLPYVLKILVPAAFPSILTGLKIGWAFAWRTLIAAELVFGVSSGQGGLGWFIFENRNLLDIPAVFAGLLTVIIIGLIVENLVFQTIERHTIQKWGMKE
ncbi:ABC transporter permease [Phyllobacterium leguminum]|uniref:NitT/TauT family transport system permease protein n=1 Tax=Phyllobacterium leguminum TaxID=314237 RepID=A0A318SYL2_9HYPH|nr:ABC transporter permease [Phyllobacterium leguminum]PYE87020.1 NitT/TauT family transport system permease protein [Phyllobacterium leguminum]